MSTQRKVAVITGASQGIGAGLVKAFLDRDYRVVANSRSIQASSNPDVLAVAGDISDRAVAERIIKEAIARFGRVDTLVNNAGIFTAKPFTAFTTEDYAQNLAVNLNGFFHITQLAIGEMEKQGSGHVVSITTTLAEHAIDGVPSVLAALTKGGLNAATKSLAIEYAKRGIRVNAVAPGVILTPFHERYSTEEQIRGMVATIPQGRAGTAQDCVGAYLFLSSDLLSGYITGQVIEVNGGQLMP